MDGSRKRRALVLGATGGIGGRPPRRCCGTAGRSSRWRDTQAPGRSGGPLAEAEWVAGDAMQGADVRRAAEGAEAAVRAVNPPGYRNWGKLVLPMIDNTVAAAKAVGARVVLPGTVYNYGHDAFPVLKEDSPQHPATEKGRIRVELERRLEAASGEGAAALVVRFGDFFGPAPGSSWFSQGLVTPGKRLAAITYPGAKGVGHAWAYLPDAGEAIARLLDRPGELEPFARFHFGGDWDADGTAMVRAVAEGVGRPDIRVKGRPWALVGIAGLFQETPRELHEMRYLWRTPARLDNTKLVAFLGEEPHTPLGEAVRRTLAALKVS